MKRAFLVSVSIILLFSATQYAYSSDKLAPSYVSDDIIPERSDSVKEEVATDLEPGAIGNGQPLVDLCNSKLPERVSLADNASTVEKIRRAIDLAIRIAIQKRSRVPAKHKARHEEAISNLIRLQDNLEEDLYLFHAVVQGHEDYLLAFSHDRRIGFSVELADRLHGISPVRLAQCIYHECVPEKGISIGREDHRVIYREIQSAVYGLNEVVALKSNLRVFIFENAQRAIPGVASANKPLASQAGLPDNNLYWQSEAMFEPRKEDDPQPEWLFEIVRRIVPSGAKTLEIACGSGRATSMLNEKDLADYEGIDINPGYLATAAERGIPPDRLRAEDVKTAELRGKYDFILASDILLYMKHGGDEGGDELSSVMDKITGALNDGGVLAVRWAAGEGTIENKGDRFVNLETRDFLLNLMRQHGLEPIFIERRTEPIYVSAEKPGKCDYWYVLARRPQTAAVLTTETELSSAEKLLVGRGDIQKVSDFLAVSDELPERADIILALGYSGNAVPEKAAELYKNYRARGSAPKILVSGWGPPHIKGDEAKRREYTPEYERYSKLLIENGVSADDILVEDESTSTYENITFSREKLAGMGEAYTNGNIILVQSPTDQMYASEIFLKTFGRKPYNCPAYRPDTSSLSDDEMVKAARRAYLLLCRLSVYGPQGSGQIGKVNVPPDVTEAAERIRRALLSIEMRSIVKQKGINVPERLVRAEAEMRLREYEKLGLDYGTPTDDDVALAANLFDRGEDIDLEIINRQRLAVSAIPLTSAEFDYRGELFKANLMQTLAEHPDKMFFMGVETGIGEAQKAQIMPLYNAIDQIESMKDAEGRKLFPNLSVKRASATELAAMVNDLKRDGKLELGNAFIAARKASVETSAYDAIKGDGGAWISAIDDSSAGSYMPVFEAITLNMLAAMNADINTIKDFYDSISDKPVSLAELKDMIKNRIIYILPRIAAYDLKKLRELYEMASRVHTSV